jgi:hypothetical protein
MTIVRSGALVTLALAVALAAAACGTSTADGTATTDRTDLSLNATGATAVKTKGVAKAAYRNITLPAGTALPLSLTSSVASDTSSVEDDVTAVLTRAIVVDGREAVPAGATVAGSVTDADGAGRVKGRGMIAFHFTSLQTGGARYEISAVPFSRQGAATKSEDATKVGIGAGAGAVIGGLLGGKKGAAEGAAVGGGAGAGVVLATKGNEVRLDSGTDVSSRLTAPLTIPVRN